MDFSQSFLSDEWPVTLGNMNQVYKIGSGDLIPPTHHYDVRTEADAIPMTAQPHSSEYIYIFPKGLQDDYSIVDPDCVVPPKRIFINPEATTPPQPPPLPLPPVPKPTNGNKYKKKSANKPKSSIAIAQKRSGGHQDPLYKKTACTEDEKRRIEKSTKCHAYRETRKQNMKKTESENEELRRSIEMYNQKVELIEKQLAVYDKTPNS